MPSSRRDTARGPEHEWPEQRHRRPNDPASRLHCSSAAEKKGRRRLRLGKDGRSPPEASSPWHGASRLDLHLHSCCVQSRQNAISRGRSVCMTAEIGVSAGRNGRACLGFRASRAFRGEDFATALSDAASNCGAAGHPRVDNGAESLCRAWITRPTGTESSSTSTNRVNPRTQAHAEALRLRASARVPSRSTGGP